jgi:hypothetical protein
MPRVRPYNVRHDESKDPIEEEEEKEDDDDNNDEFQKEYPRMSLGDNNDWRYQLKPCVSPFGPPNVKLTIFFVFSHCRLFLDCFGLRFMFGCPDVFLVVDGSSHGGFIIIFKLVTDQSRSKCHVQSKLEFVIVTVAKKGNSTINHDRNILKTKESAKSKMSGIDMLVGVLVKEQTSPATGSGSRLGSAVVIVSGSIPVRTSLTETGVFAFIATCISLFSIWLQLKNYRKPILQRYVVRILLMYVLDEGSADDRVPLYAISSWWGLKNFTVASIIDPVRDVYEVCILQETNNRDS